MPNLIRFDKMRDNGAINRGKYTFPNMAALVTKVDDVPVKQA